MKAVTSFLAVMVISCISMADTFKDVRIPITERTIPFFVTGVLKNGNTLMATRDTDAGNRQPLLVRDDVGVISSITGNDDVTAEMLCKALGFRSGVNLLTDTFEPRNRELAYNVLAYEPNMRAYEIGPRIGSYLSMVQCR